MDLDLQQLITNPLLWLNQFDSIQDALLSFPTSSLQLYHQLSSINSIPWSSLPALNSSLVSFTGFVQDTSFSTEIFPLSWSSSSPNTSSTIGSGLFRNSLPPEIYSNPNLISEYGDRQPVFLTTIPNSFYQLPTENSFPTSAIHPEKYPLPNTPHQAVWAKFYTYPNLPTPTPTLGSVISIVGILDMSDSVSIPCIHVLSVDVPTPLPPVSTPSVTAMRQFLLDALTHTLLGDQLAAEFVLYHILSHSAKRAPNGVTDQVHLYPLTLVTDSEADVYPVLNTVSSLLDLAIVHFPLSVDVLNDSQLRLTPSAVVASEEGEECDSGIDGGIVAGRLQLAHQSVLVMDELSVQEGRLNETGVKNLQTLNKVVTTHTLPYTFPYMTCSLATQYVSLIITSSLNGGLVTRGIRIPWVSNPPSSDPTSPSYCLDSLQCTAYLSKIQNLPLCQIEPGSDVQLAIESAYVQDRRDRSTTTDGGRPHKDGEDTVDLDSPTPTQLHFHIALACQVARSRGHSIVLMEDWVHARTLDSMRRSRIQALSKPNGTISCTAEPLR